MRANTLRSCSLKLPARSADSNRQSQKHSSISGRDPLPADVLYPESLSDRPFALLRNGFERRKYTSPKRKEKTSETNGIKPEQKSCIAFLRFLWCFLGIVFAVFSVSCYGAMSKRPMSSVKVFTLSILPDRAEGSPSRTLTASAAMNEPITPAAAPSTPTTERSESGL